MNRILFIVLINFAFQYLNAAKVMGLFQENDSIQNPLELCDTSWKETKRHGYIGNYTDKLWYKIQIKEAHRKMLYFTGVRLHKCRMWVYTDNQFIDVLEFGGFYGNNKYYHGEHLSIDLTKWGDDLSLYFEIPPSLGQMRLPFYLEDKKDYFDFYVGQTVFKSIWLGVLFFFVAATLILGFVLKRPLFYSIFFVQVGVLLFYGFGESGLILDFVKRDTYNLIYFIKGIGILSFSIGNWRILKGHSAFFKRFDWLLMLSKLFLFYIGFCIVFGALFWFNVEQTNENVEKLNIFFQQASRIAAINVFAIMLIYLLFERKTKFAFFLSLPLVSYLMYASVFSILMSEGIVNTPKNYLLWIYAFSIIEILLYTGVLFLEYKLFLERNENNHRGKQILSKRTKKWTNIFNHRNQTPTSDVFDNILNEVRDYSHLLNIQEEDVVNDFEASIQKLFKFYTRENANFQILVDLKDHNKENSKLHWEVYKLVYDLLQSFYFNYPTTVFFEIRNVKELIEISLEVEFERDFNKQEMTQIMDSEIYDMITQNNNAYLKLLPNNIYVTVVFSENEFVSPELRKILNIDDAY